MLVFVPFLNNTKYDCTYTQKEDHVTNLARHQ
jgi:hypothetical protein